MKNIRVEMSFKCSFDPVLPTGWLDRLSLTLKNYTAKYYEVRKI
jgi:hypothetical protein